LTKKKFTFPIIFFTVLLLSCTLTQKVFADTHTWTGASSNLWNVAGNWDVGIPEENDDLVFPSGASNLSTSNNISAGTVFNSITIEAGGYTLAGNSVSVTTSVTDSVGSGSNTISLVIGGTCDFVKSGAGTLTLSGLNTYSGTTTISNGTVNTTKIVVSGGNSNLGNAGSPVVLGDAINEGTLVYSGADATYIRGFTVNAGGGEMDFTRDGYLLIISTVDIATDGPLTIGGAGQTRVTSVISGAGSLIKSDGGILRLYGANTFSGGFTLNSGNFYIGNASAIGTGTFTINGGYFDNLVSGNITLSGNNVQIWNNDFTFGGANYNLSLGTGAVTMTTDITINVGSVGTLTVGGVISGDFTLTKTGTGAVTLTGLNTYSGVTTMNGGTLRLSGASAATGGVVHNGGILCINHASGLGTGTLTINSGSLENTSGGAVTVANNVQIWNGDFTWKGEYYALNLGAGPITLGADVTVTVNNVVAFTVGGVISGDYGLTKAGVNTLNLSGESTYTGDTTISAGTIKAAAANILPYGGGKGNVIVNGKLDLAGYSMNINGLSGSGTIDNSTGAGTYTFTVGNNDAGGTFSGLIKNTSGTVALVKTGTGTLTLSGANTYKGLTTVSAGVLNIQNAAATGTTAGGVSIADGAALEIQGDVSVGAEALTLNGSGISSGGALRNISGTNSWSGAITLGSPVRINSDADALTISGGISGATQNLTAGGAGDITISGIIGTTSGTLTKDGAGILVLSNGANTYSGGTTIAEGTLNFVSGALSGTGNIVFTGGTLQYALGNTQDTSDRIKNSTGDMAINTGLNDVVFTSVVDSSNTEGLSKTGSGSLTLQAANAFGGAGKNVTLNEGTLNINNASALGDSQNTFVIAGGTIDCTAIAAVTLNNYAQTWSGNFEFTGTNDLNLGTGVVTLSGADRTATINGSVLAVGGIIDGGFGISKAGAGALTLSGANTFSGGTTLNAGVLNIDNAAALGTGDFTIVGGECIANSNFNVSGNWTKTGGTFTPNNYTVVLSGTDQKVFGSTTFYGLTKDISLGAADTLMFQAGDTQTIAANGTITLKGGAGIILTLRACDAGGSQSDGNQWALTVDNTGTTIDVDYVDVKDSDASGGKAISQTNSIDSNNNLNWLFVIPEPPVPSYPTGGGASHPSSPEQGIESPGMVERISEEINDIYRKAMEILKQIPGVASVPETPEIGTPEIPVEELVSREAPLSMQGKWALLPEKPINSFILSPLPREIRDLVNKFPDLGKTFENIGITKITDINKLTSIKLTLPSFTKILGLPTVKIEAGKIALPKGTPIYNLSFETKQKLPTDIVFAKAAGEMIDLNIVVSVTDKGEVRQRINTISGKAMQLAVKPENPVKTIKGYVVFKSKFQTQSSKPEFSLNELLASTVFAFSTLAEEHNPAEIETRLVLTEFEYTDPDNDGIYTAEIEAPTAEGEYEIITVMDYEDSQLGTKEIRLVAVVDPEGYIFTSLAAGELRIAGAVVSLYWLNQESEQYQLWPAAEYNQENPQVTDDTGRYSFLVPEGSYYLKVEAPGYIPYQSDSFIVKGGSGIHANVELKKEFWRLGIIDWKIMIIFLFGILLFYNFYRDKTREKTLKNK